MSSWIATQLDTRAAILRGQPQGDTMQSTQNSEVLEHARMLVGIDSDDNRVYAIVEVREKSDGARWQTITHEQVPDTYVELSFTHETIDPRRRGDMRYVSLGAGLPDALDDATPHKAWNREQLTRLAELAKRWHLNTLRAGCAHQTVEYETDAYKRRVPSLDRTKPCSETGYRYGTAWLVELVPDEVLAELSSIITSHPRAAK